MHRNLPKRNRASTPKCCPIAFIVKKCRQGGASRSSPSIVKYFMFENGLPYVKQPVFAFTNIVILMNSEPDFYCIIVNNLMVKQ